MDEIKEGEGSFSNIHRDVSKSAFVRINRWLHLFGKQRKQETSLSSTVEKYVNNITKMLDNFTILKELAKRNNTTMIYSDFTNPTLISGVMELPEFKEYCRAYYLQRS